jgi:hypothetical protein
LLGFFTLMGIWGVALLRGLETIFEYTWYPVARYGYPSILFTIGIITLGWFTVLDSGLQYLRLPRKLLTVIYTLLFLIFSIIALLSLLRYYSAY